MASPALKSFNAGEFSPLTYGRTDLQKYNSSCKQLVNMIPLIQGAATRRPGTKYIGEAKKDGSNNSEFSKLIPFSRSNDISYILEFGENYIRVYYDGAIVASNATDAYSATESYKPGDWVTYSGTDYYCIQAGIGNQPDTSPLYWTDGLPYQIWTPWDADEVQNLQYVQSIDVMYIVHPDHEVHKLSSSGATSFTLEKVDFTYQAFQDENVDFDDKIALCLNAGAPGRWFPDTQYWTGAYVSYLGTMYTADRDISEYEDYGVPSDANAPWTVAGAIPSDNVFPKGSIVQLNTSQASTISSSYNGLYVLMKVPRKDSNLSEKLNAGTTTSSTINVKGEWSLTTHGTWTGELDLQRSYDNGSNWVNYRHYSSTNDANYEDNGTEEVDGVLYRLNLTHTSGAVTFDLSVDEPYYHYIIKIINNYSATPLYAEVQIMQDTLVEYNKGSGSEEFISSWSMGAWGGDTKLYGYPRAVTIYDERLCLGGNELKPNTIWTSKINDYENLTTGVLDTDAIIYTISSEKVYKINWLVSGKVLLIGTDGDEWSLGASRLEEAMSPTNIKGSRQSNFGSEYIQPLLINTSVIYVQRGARKIREMGYNWQEERYISNDLTAVSEHITESGIKEMAFMHNPHPILWVLLENGTWTGFTYEREQEVYAWHKHEITDFYMLSIAVIPGSDNNDEFWLAGKTLYSGVWRTYLCRMADFNYDETYDEYNGDSFNGIPQLTTPHQNMSYAWFLDYAVQVDDDERVQVLDQQTDSTPFTFDISGHPFSNGDKVKCFEDINFDGIESFYGQIFTVSDVSGSVFKLKNEAGTDYFTGVYNFYYTILSKVNDSITIQAPWGGKKLKAISDGRVDVTTEECGGSGTIDFNNYGEVILCGLPVESVLQPMSYEAELADGASQGRTKRISRVSVRFYETIGCTVKSNDGEEMIMNWHQDGYIMDSSPVLVSDYKEVSFKDGFDRHADVILENDTVYPMTVLLMQVWINTYN